MDPCANVFNLVKIVPLQSGLDDLQGDDGRRQTWQVPEHFVKLWHWRRRNQRQNLILVGLEGSVTINNCEAT